MAILRSIPRKRKAASFRGRVMIDTVRGVLRVRKWPKKRGTPKSVKQLFWIDWFRQANRLAKYADAASMIRAIDLSKFSGFYPRDILLKAMRGRLYTWRDETGWKWYSMAAIGDVSESLDILAQTIGSVLVRATDRWRAPPPGITGDVLTHRGAASAPEWIAPAGGGGVTTEQLTGTPLVPDGTKTQYDFDVSAYVLLDLSFDDVGFNISDAIKLRLSTDGGTVFHAGASDYWRAWLNAGAHGADLQSSWGISTGQKVTGHFAQGRLTNLRVGRAALDVQQSSQVNVGQSQNGFTRFDSPVTHIRIYSKNGNKFNAGTIRIVGLR